jgi:rhamnose transport system permease protein
VSVLDTPVAVQRVKSHRVAETFSRARELAIFAVILILFFGTAIKTPGFANITSVQQILTNSSLFILLAIGETLVIVTRNVDLSVGSTLGMSAFLVGEYYTHTYSTSTFHSNGSVIVAFLIGIGVGAFCGALIGLIVTVAKVPSLVVSLAALYIIRGILNLIGTGVQIEPTVIPSSFQKIGYETWAGIPWIFIIPLIAALVIAFAMRSFRSMRELYAIGSNPVAAQLAGVPVGRRVFTSFLLSGSLAGLGGVLFASEFATVNATAGTGYELLVIASCVVGGVAIFGGSGTVIGAGLGAILLQVINQALVVTNVSPFWDSALAGALILVAVSIDRFVSNRASLALRLKQGATRVD